MAISPQRLTIYLYSAHRAVIFAIAQLACISQGSVATQLRCGGMFSNHFTTKFSQNAQVKKIRKSVNIGQRYGQNFVAYFFGPPCKWLTFSTLTC